MPSTAERVPHVPPDDHQRRGQATRRRHAGHCDGGQSHCDVRDGRPECSAQSAGNRRNAWGGAHRPRWQRRARWPRYGPRTGTRGLITCRGKDSVGRSGRVGSAVRDRESTVEVVNKSESVGVVFKMYNTLSTSAQESVATIVAVLAVLVYIVPHRTALD